MLFRLEVVHATYSPCSTSQYTSKSAISGTTPTTCTHNMSPVSKAGRWGGEAASPHMHSALSHNHAQYTMHHVARPKSGVWGGGAARSPRMHSARARGGGGGGRLDEQSAKRWIPPLAKERGEQPVSASEEFAARDARARTVPLVEKRAQAARRSERVRVGALCAEQVR